MKINKQTLIRNTSTIVVGLLLVWLVAATLSATMFYVGLALVVLSAVLAWKFLFVPGAKKFSSESLEKARAAEAKQDFRQACLQYAVAILNGTDEESESRQRIRELWKQYGPFDYSDLGKESNATSSCDAAGYALAMKIIKESV